MIPATQLHYEFRRKFNKGDNEFNSNILAPDVDSYLNEALELWFKNRVIAADTNSEVRNDLRALLVTSEKHSAQRKDPKRYHIEYPEDLYKLLGMEVLAKKEPCGTKNLKVELIQNDDVSEMLRDPSLQPSFEYEETFAKEYSEGIVSYAMDDFSIVEGYLTYYRKPPAIATPSLTPDKEYVSASGKKITKDSGFFSSDTYAFRNVVDIAVLNALRDYNMIQDYQVQLDKILRKDLID